MTLLTLAARNLLVQDPALTALVAKSQTLGPWVFSEEPVGAKFEATGKCLIVITEEDTWTSPNDHNTMKFPQMYVDVWADPDRNPDRTVREQNAREKIGVIQDVLDKHFHTVHLSGANGQPRIWGTATQIANKTGMVILGSARRAGPNFSPIANAEGAWMGRLTYGVNLP